jgi:hypothetical protein
MIKGWLHGHTLIDFCVRINNELQDKNINNTFISPFKSAFRYMSEMPFAIFVRKLPFWSGATNYQAGIAAIGSDEHI